MIRRIGEFIDCCITGVREFGLMPTSRIVVRIGDFGQEMEIEHVKMASTKEGRVLVVQVSQPGPKLLL